MSKRFFGLLVTTVLFMGIPLIPLHAKGAGLFAHGTEYGCVAVRLELTNSSEMFILPAVSL